MLLDTIKNLKEIIGQYKLLFAIFFTGITITVAGLLYLMKYNSLLFMDGNSLTLENKTYSFFGNLESKELENLLENIEQEFSKEETTGIFLFTDDKVEVEEYGAFGSICGSYGDVNEQVFAMTCGEYIKKEEDGKVLLNDIFFMENNAEENKLGIGGQLKVQGQYLQVEGIGAPSIVCDDGRLPDLIAPYGTFLKICSHISKVDLILDQPLKKGEYNRLEHILCEGITYQKPDAVDMTLGTEYLTRFFTSGILIVLAMSSILGLYQYILMERRKEFAIYRILGMTNRQLFQRIAIEMNILLFMNCISGTIIVLVIQLIWKNTLFSNMNLYDYVTGYVTVILCGWLASVPLFRQIKKKDAFQQYITGEDI